MSRYTLPSGVLRTQVGEEEVLLNTETGQYHLLRGSGPAVVAELEAGRSLPEICDRFAERSGKDPAGISSEMEAFVGQLVDRGLLTSLDDD
jgi:Coenzyme PQQ synthesis protein D (PqqD)